MAAFQTIDLQQRAKRDRIVYSQIAISFVSSTLCMLMTEMNMKEHQNMTEHENS